MDNNHASKILPVVFNGDNYNWKEFPPKRELILSCKSNPISEGIQTDVPVLPLFLLVKPVSIHSLPLKMAVINCNLSVHLCPHLFHKAHAYCNMT